MAYAHSKNAAGRRHDLQEHLRAVAEMAAGFAERLSAEELGRYLGLWHDIGKEHPEFQRYLLDAESGRRWGRSPDHKAAGALLAMECLGPLSLALQGHHGGLTSPGECRDWLTERRRDAAAMLASADLADLRPDGALTFPDHVATDPLAAELFIRLLFSALVDADFLDTERHFNPALAEGRSPGPTLAELWRRFEADQARLSGIATDPLNIIRDRIYRACLEAAQGPPGLYRLTVPTGGGKTRSALGFALRHGLIHGMERIIVAVPFLSITEQTVGVYRGILERDGEPPVVLEHHSAARFDDDGELEGWTRLAAENWDAPLIVTTTVQLFDSLFANKPQATRKLHRLANAVIVLDEVQALPTERLAPILDALQSLTAYNTTVILSTATQPTFEAIPGLRALETQEIAPEPDVLFRELERVRYEWRLDQPLSWVEVADEMVASGTKRVTQSMAVVNTRRDAQALYDEVRARDPEALHLSAAMCGLHKRRVLDEVRRRLRAGERCHLVATQVVEAGVDIDFPLVLRALGPLDAIIQAAGRCNREGRLEHGRVVVFDPAEGGLPPGTYKTAAGIARAVLGGGDLNPNSPQAVQPYFRRLLTTIDVDVDDVQGCRRRLDYVETARRFRLIDQDTVGVVVTFGTPEEQGRLRQILADMERERGSARSLFRALQGYTVTLPRRQVERALRDGLAIEGPGGVMLWAGEYDAACGLRLEPKRDEVFVF